MKWTFLMIGLVVFAWGCKKDSSDDNTVYNWKRDLYRGAITKEGPALVGSTDMVIAPNSVYVSTDFVALTEHQKNKQKDSIYRASGRMFAFKYEKVKNK
jgi:hypothetical protein